MTCVQHALIDLCKTESERHLVQGQFALAIPGALQTLRFSMQVYGSGHIQLVPAYLLLAEANLGKPLCARGYSSGVIGR